MIAQDQPGAPRPSRWPAVLLAVIVVASVALRIPFLGGAQVDYDEGVYWESLRSLAAGHPLFSSVYSSQPPGFLLLVAPFYALGDSLASARAAMLVCFAVALVATYAAARVMFGARAAVIAALLLAVEPLMLRQSVTLQADGPAVALGMVSLALAAAASGRVARTAARPMAYCALAGVALSLAVLVKLLAVAFAVPVVLVLFLAPGVARAPRPRLRTASTRLAALAAGAALAAAALLLPFAGTLPTAFSQFVGSHLTARTLHEGGLTHDMALALARESPFYVAALLGMAVVAWRTPRAGAVLLAWGTALAALSATQHPLWPHHLAVASPLAAMAAAAPLSLHWRCISDRAALVAGAVAAGCIAVAGLATELHALDHPFTADTLPAAVQVLRRTVPPGEVITDDQFAAAAAGHDTPPELVDTSYVRIDSQPLDAATIERIAERDHVVAFSTATGRLVHVTGLLDWVRSHYPQATAVPGGGVVYTAG